MNEWMNDVQFLAQIAHLLGAYAVVLTFAYFGSKLKSVVATAGVMVYAGIKEFWFDATYELPLQTTYDNTLDFAALTAGALIALAVIFTIKKS